MKGNQFELNKKSGYWFIKNGPHSPKRLGKSLSGVLEFLSQDAERFDIGLSLQKGHRHFTGYTNYQRKNVLRSLGELSTAQS